MIYTNMVYIIYYTILYYTILPLSAEDRGSCTLPVQALVIDMYIYIYIQTFTCV